MNLRVSAVAATEAMNAAGWYEDQQAGLGDQFIDEYAAALQEIEEDPQRFSRLETVRSNREFRRRILKRFPYSIIYQVLPQEVIVLAVAHLSRRPNYWIHRSRRA